MKQLIHTWNSVTARFFNRSATRRQKRSPAPYLSGASKCVWQMDREG